MLVFWVLVTAQLCLLLSVCRGNFLVQKQLPGAFVAEQRACEAVIATYHSQNEVRVASVKPQRLTEFARP